MKRKTSPPHRPAKLRRREVLAGAGACVASAALPGPSTPFAATPSVVTFGPPRPFSFDALAQEASRSAAVPWQPPAPAPAYDLLSRIDFDAFQGIRYRRALALKLDAEGRVPVQPFHLGNNVRDPIRLYLVDNGTAREVLYSADLFAMPEDHPARALPDGIGFAGFRVMSPDQETDWLAFLGASYFRASGPYNQYGLSARGLAVDTGLPTPEEFPRFTEFWLEGHRGEGERCTICARLEGPSVAGAYRMRALRTVEASGLYRVDMEIESEIFARRDIARLGVAPLSSMFWYGEAGRPRLPDWRPEIHDADGLALCTGTNERIWRPIVNPPRTVTSTFADKDIKGFGLLQRDRDFAHYLDDGVFYDRRPSVWIEPMDSWGEGAAHLLEIPTDDEIHDNVAAYWCPSAVFRAGERRRYRYRLSWLDDISFPSDLGRVSGTWIGRGGRPGSRPPEGFRKFVIEFHGPVFERLSRLDGVEVVVTLSRGKIANTFTHAVVGQYQRWRALFDVEAAGSEPVLLRAFLRLGERALTETWIYQHFPET
jgi:glucans biosynthesis protein